MKYRVVIEIEKAKVENSYAGFEEIYSQIVEDLKVGELVSLVLLCSKP